MNNTKQQIQGTDYMHQSPIHIYIKNSLESVSTYGINYRQIYTDMNMCMSVAVLRNTPYFCLSSTHKKMLWTNLQKMAPLTKMTKLLLTDKMDKKEN